MPASVHYLASNDSTWTPPAVITLDTETRVIQEYPEVQELRCWHVRADYRMGARQLPGEHAEGGGTDAGDLAGRISRWAGRWSETWLYCHNLNFDLAVTRLPLALQDHQWTVTDMAVDSVSPWLILTSGTRKLVIADSHAIWPVQLAELALLLDIVKPPLPDGDSMPAWVARCAADTLILHTALLQTMSWHDRHQLGRWAVTGASTGWNTMRHLQKARTSRKARTARTAAGLPAVDPAAQPVVIDPSPDGLAHDRKAVYGGRRQTWRHGKLPAGDYAELDFERAYQTIMAEYPLPRKRGRWFDSLPLDSRLIDDPCQHWGIIADCEITTNVPRWPCRITVAPGEVDPGTRPDITGMPVNSRTRVYYPVGTFRTVLAGPDIAEARRLGCLTHVGHGQVHQLGYATRPWATWSLATQDDPQTPAVVRLALKHQGRAVAGKWAQRSWSKTLIGLSTTHGWAYQDAYVAGSKSRGAIIDLGGRKYLSVPDTDGDNAYPAVLAWIEAHTRVALGRAIGQLGTTAIVQCDTDGLIIDQGIIRAAGAWSPAGLEEFAASQADRGMPLDTVNRVTAPLRLRAKTTYRTLEVTGPQHLILDGHKRWSGVPASAERQADGSYLAWTWPKLAWQISNGDQRGYTRVVQTYRLAGSYAPGWLISDGTVRPVETRCDPDGTTAVVPYSESRYAAQGLTLAPGQPAALEPLR